MSFGIYDNGAIIARFVVPMTMRSNKPVFSSDTLSLKRNVYKRSPQRWELETRLEPLYSGGAKLFRHIVTSGFSETIQIVVPQHVDATRVTSSNGNSTATGGVGDSSVALVTNGTISEGTFIRFANHSKIYMVTTTGGSGQMGIYPTLRTAVPAGTSFAYRSDVIMDALYDTDTIHGMVFENGILMDNGTVKILERV
jgi:hypothetical protein